MDDSIKRSREGVRAVLALAGRARRSPRPPRRSIFALSGSVALLADLIHNFGDALTAVPLGIAFLMRSERAERNAGLFVVAAIFISACVAGVEAVGGSSTRAPPDHLARWPPPARSATPATSSPPGSEPAPAGGSTARR